MNTLITLATILLILILLPMFIMVLNLLVAIIYIIVVLLKSPSWRKKAKVGDRCRLYPFDDARYTITSIYEEGRCRIKTTDINGSIDMPSSIDKLYSK